LRFIPFGAGRKLKSMEKVDTNTHLAAWDSPPGGDYGWPSAGTRDTSGKTYGFCLVEVNPQISISESNRNDNEKITDSKVWVGLFSARGNRA